MDAIVYTSNTGFTAQYAKMLGKETGLPVYALSDAKESVNKGAKIVYLGWLMASGVKGYKQAAKNYDIKVVCGVGMGKSGTQIDEVRKANHIGNIIKVFTLQGGFDMNKLTGVYKFMMKSVSKASQKGLEEKANKTDDENDMLDLIKNGGNRVSMENLAPVIEWVKKAI